MRKSVFYHGLTIYYWALTVFIDYSSDNYDNSGVKYYLLVIPVILFVIYNIDDLLKKKILKESLYLYLFVLFASIFAIIKLDFKAVLSLMSWVLPIIIIFNSGMFLKLRVINLLFIITVIAGVVSYHLGINDFGYIPGQTSRNLHQGLWWRVSIFPHSTPPLTGIFSLIVLLFNYFHNSNLKSKMFFMTLSSYFLILSGSRTALLILFVIILTLLMKRLIILREKFIKKVISVLPVLLILFIFIFPQFLLKISLENDFLNSLIFRSTNSLSSIEAIERTLNRHYIWNAYINHYFSSPVIGIDTETVRSVGQSETMFFAYLAHHGISLIFLIIFMYSLMKDSLLKKKYLRYSIIVTFVILMLTYSSYLQPYNLIYLLLIGLINTDKVTKKMDILPNNY
ncbi:MAG: hypothetical protein H0Z33_17090 [Bacillaceae bacterium]|nr:hypothetical protein [Bacillaceae bacterium]